jgi:acetylornithine deacetylase
MSREALFSLEMIERFIGFDTTSRDSNLPLIHFVRDRLAELGVESHLTYDETGRKANLFATIGPADRPGIVLSGHTDVVPVDGQDWTTDPFALTRRDGKIFGRGVCDMKGFLAIATAFAPVFVERDLATPIHLAMSYDEEVGCLGVHGLLADLAARSLQPLACIVGEPSEMNVVRAHKGKIGGHVTVRGLEAHTGVSHIGVNAVEAAGEAIAFFKSIQRRLRDQGPHDPDFEDPKHTTIQCCMIRGGTAVNIVAGHCVFDFDVRYLPGDNPYDLVQACKDFVARRVEPEMHAVSPDTGFTWEEIPGCAALNTDDGAEVTDLAKHLAGRNRSLAVGFGTEAGHFQDAGIPTIVCGPGSIDQAHKPDEFITLEQVALCEKFLWRLVERVTG